MEVLGELIGKGTSRSTAQARKSFWRFCQYRNAAFYRDDRPHLRTLCDTLQAAYEKKLVNPDTGKPYRKLMVNVAPRMGKSYTLNLFEQWALGRNGSERIISVSYNEILSGRFGKNVRDGIAETKADPRFHIYTDVFPGVHIKDGDSAAQMWALEGSYFSFLAAGFGGTITGVGCSIGVIDDPVKNHIEAANENVLDGQWAWYRDTFLSRVEEGGMQIVVMTRWATGDLCGRLLESEPGEWYVVTMPACTDEATHTMLCPALLSWDRYAKIAELTSREILLANYQQEPIDIKGRLYGEFMTYNARQKWEKIVCYTDTADTGADYLCCLIAGVFEGRLHIIDAVYTDEAMEITEPMVADALYNAACGEACIESNNGGRGFARNVERLLWERHRWRGTKIIPRVQRQNKEARILVAAADATRLVLWPGGWEKRWPKLWRDLTHYQRKGKNAHDDAPDALTGMLETFSAGGGGRTEFASGRGRRRWIG